MQEENFTINHSKLLKDNNLLLKKIFCSLGYSYEFSDILVHEKGQLYAFSIEYDSQSYSQSNLKNFNKLFSNLSKRKNIVIDAKLVNPRFSNQGIYNCIKSQDLRIILLCTNNNFLEINDTEISEYNIFCKANQKKITYILKQYLKVIHQEIFFSVLNVNHYQENDQEIDLQNQFVISDMYQYYKERILGQLLNTLKHELSNPLFGIHALSQIISSNNVEIMNLISEITNKSKNAIDIINNCETFYNDTEDKFELISTLNHTLLILKSALKLIQIEQQHFTPDEFWVKNNKTWFTQILINLLLNASDATKMVTKAKILIVTKIVDNYLQIEIQDNGIGISEKNKNIIFNKSYTTKKNGNGIGLFISKSLAVKMGGELYVENSINIEYNSIFIYRVPIE